MQSSLVPYYLVPLRPKYLPQHPFSNTLSLRSSLNVEDQVDTRTHAHTQNNRLNYIYIFR